MIEIQSYLDLSEAEYEAHLESEPGAVCEHCGYEPKDPVKSQKTGDVVCRECLEPWEADNA